EQVQTLLNSAKELSIKAEELSAAGNKNGTVPYLKMIEETLGQSGKLLTRIDAAPQLLRDAQQRYTQNTESLRSDLADAERLGRGIPAIEQAALAAKAVIDNYSGGSAIDFLAANEELQSAEAKLDAALVNVREQEENQRRLAAHVETAQRAARDTIDDADEFISRYRSGIGSNARTYLARAKAVYNEGLNAPLEQKLSHFENARQIAQQAMNSAQQSLDRDNYHRGGRSGGGGDFLAGVIVSSILNGITNSNNSHRGGFNNDIFGGGFGSGRSFGGGGIDFGGGGGFSGGSKGF
ncbi:MAG: hypothetical protein SPG61_06065, partial [Arcanobacterium sp.]|nr:hypothetical protein [Arcanobacterium sp.]